MPSQAVKVRPPNIICLASFARVQLNTVTPQCFTNTFLFLDAAPQTLENACSL